MVASDHTSPSTRRQHSPRCWREETLLFIARMIFLLAIPASIPDLTLALSHSDYLRLVFNLGTIGVLGCVAFLPALTFSMRLGILLVVNYLAASTWLIVSGLVGTGRLYFLILIALAALMLSRRDAFLVWLLSLATIAAIYAGFAFALLPLPTEIVGRMLTPATLANSWLVQMLVSSAVGGAIVLTVARLQQSLHDTETAKTELQQLNASLEQRIDEQTTELRSNQRLLQGILDHSPTAIYARDLEGQYVMVNRSMLTMNGLAEETQVVGRPDNTELTDAPPEPWRTQEQVVVNTRAPLLYEFSTTYNNEAYTFLANTFPILNEEDELVAVGGIVTNISRRKQAEEALQESEEKYRVLVESAGFPITMYDTNGTLLLCNQLAAQHLGSEPADLVGRSLHSIFPADHAEHYMQRVRQVIESNQPEWREEIASTLQDRRWFWTGIFPVRNASGQPFAAQVIAHDITARKQAEEQIRFQARLLDEIGQAIQVTTLDGTIVYVNRATAELYGWEAADMLGRNILDVTPAIGWQPQASEIMERLRNGERWTGEFLLQRHDGSTFYGLVADVPIYNEQGELSHILGISTDITHHKQIESAMRLRLRQLEALRITMNDITTELELDPLLHAILERAIELVQATSGQIALYDKDRNDLLILACINISPDLTGTRQPLTEQGTGAVVRTRQPLIIDNYHTWPHRLSRYTTRSASALVLMPLLAGEQVLGMLIIGHDQPDHSFTDDDVELLTLFAQQATIALQNAHLFAEVQRLADTDPLTGLHNRRSFFQLAGRALEEAIRYTHPLSVLMLDIDNFKKVNDTYGHAAGDQVLDVVSYLCRSSLRTVDIVGRYGGEEIVLVLPQTESARALQVAERLRQTLAKTPVQTERGEVRISVSVGVATYPGTGTPSLEHLIDLADRALYTAKRTGRNRVVVWNKQMHSC